MERRELLERLVYRCGWDEDDRRPACLPGARAQTDVGGAVRGSALHLNGTGGGQRYRALEVGCRVGVQVSGCGNEVVLVFPVVDDGCSAKQLAFEVDELAVLDLLVELGLRGDHVVPRGGVHRGDGYVDVVRGLV